MTELMWPALWLALSAAPEVRLPPKSEVVPVLTTSRPENAEAIRAGVKAARADLEKCDGGTKCFCAALKKVRFDVSLDGGTLVVSYPLSGHTGPSFTLDASGNVIDCRP